MQVIHLDKGEGKTTELIRRADNRKGYIVCFSKDEAKRVFNEAKLSNKNIALPITYNEFVQYRGFPTEFYLDNFDMYVQELFACIFKNKNINSVTFTENFKILDLIYMSDSTAGTYTPNANSLSEKLCNSLHLEDEYQIVVAEAEAQIKELEYLLQFKKEKSKLQKLAKLERSLALIHEMHGMIDNEILILSEIKGLKQEKSKQAVRTFSTKSKILGKEVNQVQDDVRGV